MDMPIDTVWVFVQHTEQPLSGIIEYHCGQTRNSI